VLLCIAAVLGFYVRSAWSYDKSLDPEPNRADFHNLLADAFLAGQLDLAIPVPDGLRELPDPYDPIANGDFRRQGLHDLTYVDGKLYSYFGPSPVILVYIPFRLLRVGEVSPTLACLIFVAGGFLASTRIVHHVTRRWTGRVSVGMEAAALLALGFAGPMGWIVHIGRAYEVAIASGYFLVMSGVLCLCRALLTRSRFPTIDFMLAGTLLAAAVGARPNLIPAIGFVLFGVAWIWRGPLERPGNPRTMTLALVAPYVVVGVLLAWYNVARFGTLTEFGTSYMMTGENVRLAATNRLSFLARGLFEYLLSPSRFEGGFPRFRLRPASFPTPSEQAYLLEPVAGIVPNLPASVAGIVAYFLRPWRALKESPWLTAFLAVCTGVGGLTLVVTSFHFHGATMRYELDFVPLLLVASVIGWVVVANRLRNRSAWYWVFQSVGLLLLVWSIVFAVAITSYPCQGTGSC
jgi:hypothetical protein